MNKIPNRLEICRVLIEKAETDMDIVVLCSDSRGSASLSDFSEKYPEQFIEVGIAEQNLVSISAGLASCGKKAFCASPACFLSTRSYEQIKVDCAYSNTNVKLIGISGGISYGALGMSHHSAQDIAALSSIPNMRVYIPSDRHQTRRLIEALLCDNKPAYIRVGRNPVEDIYDANDCLFELDRATKICDGNDALIVACGEMVKPSLEAKDILSKSGIKATVLDMYCLKPFDEKTLLNEAKGKKLVITVEEHSPFGGLGSVVSKVLCENNPTRTICLSLPDSPVVSGNSSEVFDYYGLNGEGIASRVLKSLDGDGNE